MASILLHESTLEDAAAARAQVIDTERFACSVECCPAAAHTDAMVVATYQLDEATDTRAGDVQLFRVSSSSSSSSNSSSSAGSTGGGGGEGRAAAGEAAVRYGDGGGKSWLDACGKLEMPTGGVLDCKWNPGSTDAALSPLLACATATGSLALVQLSEDWRQCSASSGSSSSSSGGGSGGGGSGGGGGGASLRLLEASEPTGYLFLSVDWDNRPTHGGNIGYGGGRVDNRANEDGDEDEDAGDGGGGGGGGEHRQSPFVFSSGQKEQDCGDNTRSTEPLSGLWGHD